MSAKSSAEPVVLGRVAGVFGVKGWVKLFSYTEPRDAILAYKDCLIKRDGQWDPIRWDEGKTHGKAVIARLQGITERDAAEQLIGAELGIRRQDLPDTEPGHFYWSDLEGLTISNRDGRELGQVGYMLATGANDVMVVQGERELLIPFVMDEVVLDVDLAAGTIRVDWKYE